MDKLLLVAANITINWTGPWVFPSPEYPAPTAPTPPALPAPIPPPLPLLEMLITFLAISLVAGFLVWWYGFRRSR